jgi:hypothetical protein
MQEDFDADGAGDACDADDDADGVVDADDACPGTERGDVVLPGEGCSLEQICPCDGPMGQSLPWRSHRQYLGCVYRHANALLYSGRIGFRERNRLVAEAFRSECGEPWAWPQPHDRDCGDRRGSYSSHRSSGSRWGGRD